MLTCIGFRARKYLRGAGEKNGTKERYSCEPHTSESARRVYNSCSAVLELLEFLRKDCTCSQ